MGTVTLFTSTYENTYEMLQIRKCVIFFDYHASHWEGPKLQGSKIPAGAYQVQVYAQEDLYPEGTGSKSTF